MRTVARRGAAVEDGIVIGDSDARICAHLLARAHLHRPHLATLRVQRPHAERLEASSDQLLRVIVHPLHSQARIVRGGRTADGLGRCDIPDNQVVIIWATDRCEELPIARKVQRLHHHFVQLQPHDQLGRRRNLLVEPRNVPEDDLREVAHVRDLARSQRVSIARDCHAGHTVRMALQIHLVVSVLDILDDDRRAERVDDVLVVGVQDQRLLDFACRTRRSAASGRPTAGQSW